MSDRPAIVEVYARTWAGFVFLGEKRYKNLSKAYEYICTFPEFGEQVGVVKLPLCSGKGFLYLNPYGEVGPPPTEWNSY